MNPSLKPLLGESMGTSRGEDAAESADWRAMEAGDSYSSHASELVQVSFGLEEP